MADNKGFKVKNVIKFLGSLLPTTQGEVGFNGNSLEVHDGTSAKEVTLNSATQTLTNKSISGSTNTFSNIPSSAVNTGAATTSDIATSNTDSTVNIGTGTGANVVNIGGANTTVNITGSVNNENVTNLNVSDKLITINDGAGAASGGSAGIEIEEAGAATAYVQTASDRNSWKFKAPNTAGVATLTPGSSTDDVVLAAATQALTNKDVDGATASNTSRITLPKNTKTNLDGLTRKQGTIMFDTDSGKPYYDDGTNLKPVGSGSGGGKNYLENGDAEGSNSWVAYDDSAAVPVDGTGGTTSLTVTSTATNPLTGTKSWLLTPHSSLGEGVAYDVTLDREDRYKVITCELSLEVASGTYADDDLTVYLYDVTNSTLIYASPISGIKTSPINNTQKFNFQATGSLSYRLLIHQATANSGYTMKFEAKLGPQLFAGYAPIQTEWQSYTPTFSGMGTVTNISFFSRRNGSNLEIMGKWATGTTAASEARISLGFGGVDGNVTSDATVIPTIRYVGTWAAGSTSSTFVKAVLMESGLNYLTFGYNAVGTPELTKQNGSALFVNSADHSLTAVIPIQGWSSQSQVISQYDGRVVAAKATGNPSAITTPNPIIVPTKEFDSHDSYNSSTGKFKAKVAGKYRIHGVTSSNIGGGNFISVYKNNVFNTIAGSINSNGGGNYSASVDLLVNDEIFIASNVSGTFDGNCTLNIDLLSGAQQILAGQNISSRMSYAGGVGGTSVTVGNPVPFDTVTFDKTGALTTGASAKFTAPVTGIYQYNFQAAASTAGLTAIIYKNGSLFQYVGYTDTTGIAVVSDYVELNVNDYIDIRFTGTTTVYGSGHSNPVGTYFSIKQVN